VPGGGGHNRKGKKGEAGETGRGREGGHRGRGKKATRAAARWQGEKGKENGTEGRRAPERCVEGDVSFAGGGGFQDWGCLLCGGEGGINCGVG